MKKKKPTLSHLNLSVTEEHIKNGVRKSCTSCPIALAAIEALGAKKGQVEVTRDAPLGYFSILFSPSKFSTYAYRLSIKAFRFASDFDSGHAVSPMREECALTCSLVTTVQGPVVTGL